MSSLATMNVSPDRIVVGFSCAGANDEQQRAGVTSVQKDIELRNGVVEKGKIGKHEERVQSAAYKQVCDDTPGEKQGAIKEANERIEILQAGIQKYEADAAHRADEIAKHDDMGGRRQSGLRV